MSGQLAVSLAVVTSSTDQTRSQPFQSTGGRASEFGWGRGDSQHDFFRCHRPDENGYVMWSSRAAGEQT